MTHVLADHGLWLDATDRPAAEAEATAWCAARGLDDEDLYDLRIPSLIRRAWWSTSADSFVDRSYPDAVEVWIAHVPEHLLTEEV